MIAPDAKLLTDTVSKKQIYDWLKETDVHGFMVMPCAACGRHFIPTYMDGAHIRGKKRFNLSIMNGGGGPARGRTPIGTSRGAGSNFRGTDITLAEYITEVWKCVYWCKGCHVEQDARLKRGGPICAEDVVV